MTDDDQDDQEEPGTRFLRDLANWARQQDGITLIDLHQEDCGMADLDRALERSETHSPQNVAQPDDP